MQNPAFEREEAAPVQPGRDPQDPTQDRRTFTAAVRARIFAFLHALAGADWEEALAVLAQAGQADPQDLEDRPWTEERLKGLLDEYRSNHEGPRLDPEGRNLRHTYVEPKAEDPTYLVVQQMLVDMEGANDWVVEFQVDLEASREFKALVMDLVRVGPYA